VVRKVGLCECYLGIENPLVANATARLISGQKGIFHPELTKLSDTAAEILGKHEGLARVDLDFLPASAAKILRRAGKCN